MTLLGPSNKALPSNTPVPVAQRGAGQQSLCNMIYLVMGRTMSSECANAVHGRPNETRDCFVTTDT